MNNNIIMNLHLKFGIIRSDIRRTFAKNISKGTAIQLLWVFALIVISFGIFLLLARLFIGPDIIHWQDIIALYLDPGVFGGEGEYDIFRLLVTLVGALLFTAVLISIVSNIFENISESYKKGESRYKFSHHILIIGSSKVLSGMLSAISADKKYNNKQIVIMANRPIVPLQDEISAYLNDDKLLNRITFYYDRRDNKINLERANAGFADYIFVIGEDNEPYHDFISLQCLKYLREIITQQKKKEQQKEKEQQKKSADISGSPSMPNCFVLMGSQSTMKSYQLVGTDVKDKNGNPTFVNNPNNSASFNESVLNINECKAEVFLKNIQSIITKSSEGNTVFFTIYGMTSFSRALATTIAYSFHFKDGRKTIITVIDNDIKNKIRDFQTRYDILFHYCDCNYNVYDIDAIVERAGINDICWNFIEDIPSSHRVFDYLKSIQKKQDDGDAIGITTICYEDISKNLATEVSIRQKIGGINVYADFAEYDDALSLQSSMGTNSKVSSEGLNFEIKKSFKYIFCERQDIGQNYYNIECPNMDWNKLPFADKQKYIYLGFALNLWQKGNDSKKSREFTNFLMGRSKNKDGKSFYYFEDPHYMKAVYKHFHYYDSDPCEEHVDDISNTKEDCEKVQSLYIEALENGREFDLYEFIKFEIRVSSRDSGYHELLILSEELFQAISEYSSKFGLSQNCIDALLDLIRKADEKTVDDLGYAYCQYNQYDLPDFAKKASDSIISKLAEDGNGYACLAKSSLSDKIQNRVEWYKKAVSFPDIEVPDQYFEEIPDVKIEQFYRETESCFCLDWIIRKGLPELNSGNYDKDYIGTLENTVAKLTKLSGAELYWRIAFALHSKPCYQGMWLRKAESAAQRDNNDELLYYIYLALGDYFEYRQPHISAKYYKLAYKKKAGEEAIQKYGRCLYWGWLGVNKDKEAALKIGYKLKDESKEFIQQREEEEMREEYIYEEELGNFNQYEVDMEYYEKEVRKVKDRITEWEKNFPHIDHPYQKVLEHFGVSTPST